MKTVFISLGELSGGADNLIDLRLGPISARAAGLGRGKSRGAKEEPRQGGAESSGRTVERDIHNRRLVE
jgi:hypothetical protein